MHIFVVRKCKKGERKGEKGRGREKGKREEEVTSLISSTIFHVNLFHNFLIPSHVQFSFCSLSFFSFSFLLFLPFASFTPLVRIFYSSHTSDTDCVNIILDSLPSSLHCVLLSSLHFLHSSSFPLLSFYSFHTFSLSNND